MRTPSVRGGEDIYARNSGKREPGKDEVVDGEKTVGDLRREGRSDSGEGLAMKTRKTYRR